MQLILNGISIDLIVESYALLGAIIVPSHTQHKFQLVPIYYYTSMNASHHITSSSVTHQTMNKSINYYIMRVCGTTRCLHAHTPTQIIFC